MISRISDLVGSALRKARDGQAGQSLPVIVLSMAVIIGISAFAIDVATWYQQHHQTQVAADGAALAAANCLANAGTSVSVTNTTTQGPACTSDLDVADAKQVAVTYAKANGIKDITTSDVSVDTSTGIVTVRAKSTAPAFFARLFGIQTATVSAGAGASFKSSIPCSQAPGTQIGIGGCAAIYAHNNSCTSGGVSLGINANGGAAIKVTGVVHSEGLMSFPNTTSASGFTVALDNPPASTGCYGGTSTLSPPSAGKTTASTVTSYSWPIDYRDYFTACDPSGTPACKQLTDQANTSETLQVPSYCTYASSGPINLTSQPTDSSDVFCDVGSGTSVDSTDPTTWNGAVTITTGIPDTSSSGCNTLYPYTFIAGSITALNPTGILCLKPDPVSLTATDPATGKTSTITNNCLMYATQPDGTDPSTGSTVPAIDMRQAMTWTGDLFAPLGTINLGTTSTTISGKGTGGGKYSSSSGMLEGLNVSISSVSLDLTADGTINSGGGGGGTSVNSDQLTS